MTNVTLDVGGRLESGVGEWDRGLEGRLHEPTALECGECTTLIQRGDPAIALKGDDARTVYCGPSCAAEHGYVGRNR